MQIFFPKLGCLFTLFIVSFTMQKLLNLSRFHLLIFVFISIILGDGSKKILLWFISQSVPPMFSSSNFIVSDLTFRSLIHFVYGVKEWSDFIFFYMWLSSFPSTICWRDCLYNIVWSCLFYHRLIDHRCVGLSCSTDSYFIFGNTHILSQMPGLVFSHTQRVFVLLLIAPCFLCPESSLSHLVVCHGLNSNVADHFPCCFW